MNRAKGAVRYDLNQVVLSMRYCGRAREQDCKKAERLRAASTHEADGNRMRRIRWRLLVMRGVL